MKMERADLVWGAQAASLPFFGSLPETFWVA